MEQAATNNKFQSPGGARNEKALAAAHEAPRAERSGGGEDKFCCHGRVLQDAALTLGLTG